MPKIDVIDASKKVVNSMELSEKVFAAKIREPVVHQVVVAQMAKKRAGTHSTKTRGEVRGGGRKPWKQKGTGRARAGSIRSPIWRGGGITFGPKPRDHSFSVPKKMRKAALNSALSSLVLEGRFVVVDSLAMDEIKTKKAVELLKKIDDRSPYLVIHGENCDNFVRSSKNIPNAKTLTVAGLNVYDLLRAEVVICTSDAVKAIEQRLSK